MQPEDFPELLTTDKAAKRLGVSTKHLLKLVADGAIKYIDIGRGRVKIRRRFDPADLIAFIDARRRVVQAVPKISRRSPYRGVALPSPGAVENFAERLKRAAAAARRR